MSRRQRMEEAARWSVLRRDPARFDEEQRQALIRWLRASKRNLAAFIATEILHADIVRRELARRNPHAVSARSGSRFDRLRLCMRTLTQSGLPRPTRPVMSRRQVIGAVAAGLSAAYVTGGLPSVITARRENVISSGHVRLVRLSGGVMHAARHSAILSEGGMLAQMVSLSAGQAAFDLWEGVRTVTRVMTPFAEIFATSARFGVLVVESMTVVTVVQGSVSVRAAGSNAAERVVAAGHKLTVRPGVNAQPIALANVERELGWTQGDLYFESETILEAAAAFNRFNELQIRPSPAIAHLTVGSHHCALSDPQRFVTRFVTSWKLGSRMAGNVIEIFERDQGPESR